MAILADKLLQKIK